MKNFPSCTYLVIVTGPLSNSFLFCFQVFFSSSKKQLGGQQVHQRCKFFNRLIRGSKRVNNYHFSGFYQRENLSTYHKIIMMTSFQTKTFYVYVSFHFKNIFSKFYGKSSVRKLSSIYILILILKQNYCVKNKYYIYCTLTDHTQKIQMKLCTYISAIHFCWKIDKKRDGGQDEDETKYFKVYNRICWSFFNPKNILSTLKFLFI